MLALWSASALSASAATFTVSNTDDAGSGSLRQAILDANASTDDSNTIAFNIPTSDPGFETTESYYSNRVRIKPETQLPAITKDNTFLDGYTQYYFVSGPSYYTYARVVIDGSEAAANTIGLRLFASMPARNYSLRQLDIENFGGSGVRIQGDRHYLSETRISGNGGDGLAIASGIQTRVRSCSIFDNGKLGINLIKTGDPASGVTPNDAADADTGPNNLQNFPVVSSAYYDPARSRTHIQGTLTSTPNSQFYFYIFSSASSDGSGYGEGESQVATAYASTNESGAATWSAEVYSDQTGRFIAAVAERYDSSIDYCDTSEFSATKQVVLTPGVVQNTKDSGAGSLRSALSFANANPGTYISFRIPKTDSGFNATTGQFTIAPLSALPSVSADGTIIDGRTQTNFSGDTNPNQPEIVLAGSGAGAGANGLTLAASNAHLSYLEIRNFGGNGVEVTGAGSVGNSILFMSLHDNGKLGIDLNGGTENSAAVTANDTGDADTGPNNLQNAPVLDSALYEEGANITRIRGHLNSTASSAYFQIQLYRSGAADALSYGEGEGQIFVAEQPYLSTDASGNKVFEFAVSGRFDSEFFSATATQSYYGYNYGNTSEFSNVKQVLASPVVTNTLNAGAGSLRAALTFANSNPNTTINFRIPTTDANYNATTRIFTIKPASALPTLSGAGTIINGFSQRDTTGSRSDDYNAPVIILDGTGAGAASNGLSVDATDTLTQFIEIRNFGGNGIRVIGGTRNRFAQTPTSGNGKLGIDLAKSGEASGAVTPNDSTDADTGPNNLQNAPLIASAEFNSGNNYTAVSGTLETSPNEQFQIDLYRSPSADASGNGEGQTFVASTTVYAGSDGAASFSFNVSGSALVGQFFSATASRRVSGGVSEYSDTSEFSNAKQVITAPDIVTNTNDTGVGSLRAALIYANANPNTTIKFNIPTSDPNYVGNYYSGAAVIKPASALPTLSGEGTIIDGPSERIFTYGYAPYTTEVSVILDGSNLAGTPNGLTIGASKVAVNHIGIRNFGGNGIRVLSGSDNRLAANAISNNGKLGIDLAKSGEALGTVTPNDDTDADSGPNDLQNAPLITGVEFNSANNYTTVSGTLNSTPNQPFLIELFRSSQKDASGFGEGEFYLTQANVNTNGDGNASFSFNVYGSFAGQWFTALAHQRDDATYNYSTTSEFSNAKGLSLDNVVVNTNDAGEGSLRAALTFANANPNTEILFNIPDTDPNFESSSSSFVIKPVSALPAISGSGTRLSGISQQNFNNRRVTLDGSSIAAANTNGLSFTGSNGGVSHLSIRGFSGAGISVAAGATGNRLAANNISNNGKLGINLVKTGDPASGVTSNDAGDADTGANGLQNFPVITGASVSTYYTNLRGTLNSTANTSFTLQFFRSTEADASGNGEGAVYVGETSVTTDGDGNANYDFNTDYTGNYYQKPILGSFYSATAINTSTGDTSEFGPARQMGDNAVRNTKNSGTGSLRAAIAFVNANSGLPIVFAIPTDDEGFDATARKWTLKPATPLPALSANNVSVDGYSNAYTTGDQGSEADIIIDGSLAGANANGLTLAGNSASLNDLRFQNWSGAGVRSTGTASSFTSLQLQNNGTGLLLDGATNNYLRYSRIESNTGHGVQVSGGSGNYFDSGNSWKSNGKLGIDLVKAGDPASGVTPNDDSDADTGSNNLQNAPVIDAAGFNPGNNQTTVKGRLKSTPSTQFQIQLYRSTAADSSGFGEGEAEVTSVYVTTGSDGSATFSTTIGNYLDQFITATARKTGSPYDTSEFSNAAPVVTADVVTNTNDAGDGSLRAVLTYANANPNSTVKFNISTGDSGYDAATGSFVIALQSALPDVSGNGTKILGASQTGFNGKTIVLDGAAAGNAVSGLTLKGSQIRVENLEIRNFKGAGIRVTGTTARRNRLSQNSIHDNGTLGIDLVKTGDAANGVTLNDADDADTGPNDAQNFPVINSAVYEPGFNLSTLKGTLKSTPNTDFRIEFFAATAADASGYGEGQTFLDAVAVATDASGSAAFSKAISGSLSGKFISATAIDLGATNNGNTSEFSAAKEAVTEAKPNISISNVTVDPEGDTGTKTATFTVSLSKAYSQAVTVDFATANGTASAPSDFTAQNGTLTFAPGTPQTPGETSKTISVVVKGDTANENNEAFRVNLSNPSNGILLQDFGTATIVDDDPLPNLSIGSVSVDPEGNAGQKTATFTVSLSAPSVENVLVDFATSNGSAQSGLDYTAKSGTLTFAAGTTSKTIEVDVLGDALDEDDETLRVTLSNARGAGITTAQGTATIKDDDAAPTVSVNDVSLDEGQSGAKNFDFKVSLSAASGKAVSVKVASADDSASSPSDFSALALATLTFAAGETEKTVSVSVKGDTATEPNETFFVNLSAPSNATIGDAQGVGTIQDDDASQRGSLQFSSATYSAGEGDGTATLTVTRTGGSTGAVGVSVASTTGTATAGSDYTALSSALSFADGETQKTFSLAITNDATDEDDETVRLVLSGPTGGAVLGTPVAAILTIADNDAAPRLSADDAAIAEGDSGTKSLQMTVRLSAPSARVVTVKAATSDGTASAPSDYTALAATLLTFAPNETSKTVNIVIKGDTAVEPNETFTLTLSEPSNATLDRATATAIIATDDNLPVVSVNSVKVNEGDNGPNSAAFVVSLSAASPNAVTVGFATANGSAQNGQDYQAQSGTATIAAGQTQVTIPVSILGDTLDESDETFTLTLSNPVGATLGTATGTATITDDDGAPLLRASDARVTEGSTGTATLSFLVSLSSASGKVVTVKAATSNGTASAPADYTALAPATLTFAAGETQKTVSVSVKGDTLDEADETLSLVLTDASNASLGDASGIGTITDDDGPTISVNDASASETDADGVKLSFAIRLAAPSPDAITVSYSTSDGTATAGADYSPTSGQVTFAPGETTKTVSVPLQGNNLDENDETVLLSISVSGGATITRAQATGTIRDDDEILPSLSVDDVARNEGDGITDFVFRVRLSGPSGKTVSAAFATAPGTAGSDDFIENSGTLTFAPGQLSALVTVQVRGDDRDESDELFTLNLSKPANALLDDAQGAGTIVNDDSVALSVSDVTVKEGNSGLAKASFTVSLSAAAASDVSVNYATAPGTAVVVGDYTGATGTLSFSKGETSKTVVVDVKGDTFFERDETFFLNLSSVQPARVRLAKAQGIATIQNDDSAPYRATVVTDVNTANVGTAIPLRGRALSNANNAPVADALVAVRVLSQGTRRVLNLKTDSAGNYATVFYPLGGEAGSYGLAAAHPQSDDDTVQDSFRLVGLRAGADGINLRLVPNVATSGKLTLSNLSSEALSGLGVKATGAPAGISSQLDVDATLPGDGSLELSYAFTATSNTAVTYRFVLNVSSSEGASLNIPVTLAVVPLAPDIVANPSFLEAGMLRGRQQPLSFVITNRGGAPSGEMTVSLPTVSYLRLLSSATVPSLSPGESATINLSLQAPADLPLTRYSGTIGIGRGQTGVSVPFRFTAISEARGDIELTVTDEYAYLSSVPKNLAGAEVTLRDQYDNSRIIAQGKSGADGKIAFSDVAEGTYLLRVTADKHSSYSAPFIVRPGVTNRDSVFLSLQTVTYTWTVVPTEIEDVYDIKLVTTFVTEVPAPVVTITLPENLPSIVPGESTQIDAVLRNKGLIKALDVKLQLPQDPEYTFEALTTDLGDLPAQSAITVPITVTRRGGGGLRSAKGSAYGAAPALRAAAAPSPSPSGGEPCELPFGALYGFECGPEGLVPKFEFTIIKLPQRLCNTGGPNGRSDPPYIPPSTPGTGGGNYSGGGGGGGGEGGSYETSPPVPCDPCEAKILTQLLRCAYIYLPLDKGFECVKGLNECIQNFQGAEGGLETAKSLKACYDSFKGCREIATGKPKQIKCCLVGTIFVCLDDEDLVNELCDQITSGDDEGGEGERSALRAMAADTKTLRSSKAAANIASGQSFFLDQLETRVRRLDAVIDGMTALFGDEVWTDVEDADALTTFLEAYDGARQASSPGAELITEAERTGLHAVALPAPVTIAKLDQLIDRWNRTWTYWSQGIFNKADVPQGQSRDFLALDVLKTKLQAATDADNLNQAEGFSDSMDAVQAAARELKTSLTREAAGGTCARIKLQIDQRAVLTRQAFAGTLSITNGRGAALTQVKVDLDIRDENDLPANDKFFAAAPQLAALTGVDGTGKIEGNATGSAKYTFIPKRTAAPDGPTIYRLGGVLSYFDPDAEAVVTAPLYPATITVYPDANLKLNYFQERGVQGDDPFTEEIEPSVPFNLGLLVSNTGKGAAKNFSITSAQPKIVENDKGLLIDFQIVGTQVGNRTVTPTLTASLGDVEPGKTQVARWLLTSTLQGKFVDYQATFAHASALGGMETSLIESVDIHELIHVVKDARTGADEGADFLTNDIPDGKSQPDTLWFSDGTKALVNAATNAQSGGSGRRFTLSANQPSGWSYLNIPDPGQGLELLRVVRSDGKEISVGDAANAWQTNRTFNTGNSSFKRENVLHLLDFNGTGSYTLFYRSTDRSTLAVSNIEQVTPNPTSGAVASLEVTFSKAIDAATFDFSDLTLSRNGGANLVTSAVSVAPVSGNTYRIGGLSALTSEDGNYVLSVSAAAIKDEDGVVGAGSASSEWPKGTGAPVVVQVGPVTPDPRRAALDSLEVSFSKSLDAATFDRADVTLKRDGGANLVSSAVTVEAVANTGGKTFRIGGLNALTGADGTYVLTVNAAGVRDAQGNAGTGSKSDSWLKDASGPIPTDVEDVTNDPRNIVVTDLDVTFSEPINEASFDRSDLSLTRGGGANLINNEVTVTKVSATTYRIAGINWVSGAQGVYKLTVSGSGIEDLAGNAGSGSAFESWTMDTSDPAAPTGLGIAPDAGTPSDGITNSAKPSLTGTLAEPGLTVWIEDATVRRDLGSTTVSGQTFNIALGELAAGRHVLSVHTTDAAGNVSPTVTFDLFVDLTAPNATLETIAPNPRDTALASVDVSFSEAVSGFDRSDLVLTRNGGANLVSDAVSVASLGGNAFRIGGLTALTGAGGNYVLSVKANGVSDVAGNGNALASTSWTRTATDNRPSISIADAQILEGSSGSKELSFAVTLSSAATAPVTVNYATLDNTASAPGDYTAKSGTLTFPAGVTSQTVKIAVKGDLALESDETFAVNLQNPSSNATLGDDQALGLIQNDDASKAGSFAFGAATFSALENVSSGAATVTVKRIGGSDGAVTVNYAATGGTAGANDFTATNGTLLFGAGETLKSFTVALKDDELVEGSETVNLALSSPSGGAAMGTPSTAVLTLKDSEPVPSLAIGNVRLVEGNAGTTNAIFTVTLSAPSEQTVSVGFATQNGSALSGSDFVAQNGTLSFAPRQISRTVSVVINGDTAPEADDVFSVALSNPTNATLRDAQGTGTIVNDDASTNAFSVRGRLSDIAGRPIAGATIRASRKTAAGYSVAIASASSDAAGNYSLALGAGSYILSASKSYLSFAPSSQFVPVERNVENINFLGSYSLRGQVVNAAAQPVNGVKLVLSGDKDATTTTNSRGEYRFSGLNPGTYSVVPQAAEGEQRVFTPTARRNVTLTNAPLASQNFVAEPKPLTASGRIFNVKGAGVAGVLVSAVNASGTTISSALSNVEGHYSVPNLPPGTYTLKATLARTTFTPDSYSNLVLSDTSATGKDFQAIFSVSGSVLTQTKGALAGVDVYLASSLAELAAPTAKTPKTQSNDKGGFVFDDVAPGAYFVGAKIADTFFKRTVAKVGVSPSSPSVTFVRGGSDTTAPSVTVVIGTTGTAPRLTRTARGGVSDGQSGVAGVIVRLTNASGAFYNWTSQAFESAPFDPTRHRKTASLSTDPQTGLLSWSLALPSNLPNGTYTVAATALDNAFNSTTQSANFSVGP